MRYSCENIDRAKYSSSSAAIGKEFMTHAFQTVRLWCMLLLGWFPLAMYPQQYASRLLPQLPQGRDYYPPQSFFFSLDGGGFDTMANGLKKLTLQASLNLSARYAAARALYSQGNQHVARQALLSLLNDISKPGTTGLNPQFKQAVLCTLFLWEDRAGSCQDGLAYVQQYGHDLDSAGFGFIYGLSKIELGDVVNGIHILKQQLALTTTSSVEHSLLQADYCNNIADGFVKLYLKDRKIALLDTAALYYKKASGFAVGSHQEKNHSSVMLVLQQARIALLKGAVEHALSLYTRVEGHAAFHQPPIWQAICIGRAECYSKLNQPSLAVQWCDSFLKCYEQSSGLKEQLLQSYKLFSSNYEKLNKVKEANQYMRLTHEVQDDLHNHRLAVSGLLHAIDMAHLKQQLSKQLDHQYTKNYLMIIGIIILIMAGGLFYYFRIHQKGRRRQVPGNAPITEQSPQNELEDARPAALSAQEELFLQEETNLGEETPVAIQRTVTEVIAPPIEVEEIEALTKMAAALPTAYLHRVQKGLEKFEEAKGFTEADLTLAKLARKLKTNTTYLSQYFNQHLQKGFTDYLNELRIQFVLDELHRNPTYKQYTTRAIAEEAGYKNQVTFMHSFKKITGTTLSVYVAKMAE